MSNEANPTASGGEVEFKTETMDAVAVEQKPEETPEPEQEKEPTAEEKEAKRQERLDKRFAKLTRKANEAMERAAALERQLAERGSKPQEDAGDDDIESVIERKVAEREQRKAAETFHQKSIEILEKAAEIGDFDPEDIILLPKGAADAVVELGKPEVFAYLQNNPEEIERLEKLTPYMQAVEVGKLDAKLSAPKPVKKSTAPTPVQTVQGGKAKGISDLYSIENTDDWIRERNKQVRG